MPVLREPFDGAQGSPRGEWLPVLLRDLRTSRERLLAVVSGVSEEQFKRRPAPPPNPLPAGGEGEMAAGEWSIAEVLAHLMASEQRAGERMEALLAGQAAPGSRPNDEERNAEARRGRSVPVPQIIHGLLAARRRLERALTEAGVEPAQGAVLRMVQEDVVQHEVAHTAQIEAVKAALGAGRGTRG